MSGTEGKEEKVICPSCGGAFDRHEEKCPYCGTMYYPGAEKAYLSRLDGIRRNAAALGSEAKEQGKKEAARQMRRVLRIVLIVLVLAALAFGIRSVMKAREREKLRAEYQWMEEMFPIYDELYEKGDFEALEKERTAAIEKDMPFWNWEHAGELADRLP